MGTFIGRLIIIVIALAVVGAVLFGIIASQEPPQRASAEPRPIAVFVERAERDTIALQVSSQGEARPRTQINLVPQVAGRITYVNPSFIEGGFFEAGETLIQIEDADYRLAVVRAQATVAQRQQQLAREQAESELAAEEWAVLGEGEASALTLREPQMAEAQAALAAAQASLQEARLNLQRTRVSAPFSGRVRSKDADLGQYVTPGTNLGQVFATDQVIIRLPLTDHQLNLLGIPVAFNAAEGDGAIPVRLNAMVAGRRVHWDARITRTDSAIDSQTRVLYAIAEIDDPYGEGASEDGVPLAVGMFVSAEITGREVAGAYVMPRSALRGDDRVFVAQEGGRLAVRTVDVVTSDPERVIVTSGVDAGEYVIVSPVRGASDGMRIQSLDENGQVIAAYSALGSDDDEEETTGLANAGEDGEGRAVASAE